jgi:anti-sigma factor RsiW
MAERDVLDEDLIQDYIDDRLNERDRASVAAMLLASPKIAAEVDDLRRQNEALKMVGRDIIDEPVPDRLRAALQRPVEVEKPAEAETETILKAASPRPAQRSHFLEAAAAVLLFVVGVGAGWMGSSVLRPGLTDDDLAIAGVARAFADFGGEAEFPIQFPPDRQPELASWISRSFERNIEPPDLETLDYRYIGGRLMPSLQGRIGSFMFENEDSSRLAVFFWPRTAPPSKVIELSRDDDVETRFWFGDGFGFAVVGHTGDAGVDQVANQVFDYYESVLPSSE